eukprot:scaffold732_cov60-Phaeocystis_antarctica.AAC.9
MLAQRSCTNPLVIALRLRSPQRLAVTRGSHRALRLQLCLRRLHPRRCDRRRRCRRRRRAVRLRERGRECGLRSVCLRRAALRLRCCDVVPLRELSDHTAHLLLQSPSLLLRLCDLKRSGRGRFVALALQLHHLRCHRALLALRLSRCVSRLRKRLVALALQTRHFRRCRLRSR